MKNKQFKLQTGLFRRSSLRTQRNNKELELFANLLDCFASLAMTGHAGGEFLTD